MRPARLAPAALLLLAACPLPQSVPSVPAGSVTPPRILEDGSLSPSATAERFDPNCTKKQSFTVTAKVADENFSEAVEYRWFVDYDPTTSARWYPIARGFLDVQLVEPFNQRAVPPQPVIPVDHMTELPTGTVVVELVVSNGFDVCPPPGSPPPSPPPCRSPQLTAQNTYEVQSHKWVFIPVAGCATAVPPTCVACPP